ncbi:MAG: hypothetical protein KDC08_12600, partial [Actinobacteria bacterium]|nr:hypothetical protein [Actinomycetota bacterium]
MRRAVRCIVSVAVSVAVLGIAVPRVSVAESPVSVTTIPPGSGTPVTGEPPVLGSSTSAGAGVAERPSPVGLHLPTATSLSPSAVATDRGANAFDAETSVEHPE